MGGRVVGNNDHLRGDRYDHYSDGMKKVASGFSPLIAVDRRDRKPLHLQIYEGYRRAILRRNLSAGQQVPSSRQLALELKVSRIPVLNAYAQLLAEGYFEARTGAGTFVSSSLAERGNASRNRTSPTLRTNSSPRPVSPQSNVVPRYKASPWIYGWGAFGVGQVSLDHFPFPLWSRLLARHGQRVQARALHFSDPMGSREFRTAIATYLRMVRAVNCDADQIMIVSGSQQALEITARVLLEPRSRAWIEEPSYWSIRRVLGLAGCVPVPVAVDQEGLNVAAGIKAYRHARAAFVTPSHQFPLGSTMSAARRIQLLEWAEQVGAWIIEDDYDSEYRYEGMPIASLQGLDHNSRVIYIGTFSKTLFPSLRVGYLVIPHDLVARFLDVRLAMDLYPAHLYQAVLTDFMREGHFARHVRRTKQLYQERRGALIASLENHFGDSVEILGADAGLHLVAVLPKGIPDEEVADRAAQERLWLFPLSRTYFGTPVQGLILGFGSTQTKAIPEAVHHLERIVAGLKGLPFSRAVKHSSRLVAGRLPRP
jgi:GntR family transcriptional regulator/MocR family aminotransferase